MHVRPAIVPHSRCSQMCIRVHKGLWTSKDYISPMCVYTELQYVYILYIYIYLFIHLACVLRSLNTKRKRVAKTRVRAREITSISCGSSSYVTVAKICFHHRRPVYVRINTRAHLNLCAYTILYDIIFTCIRKSDRRLNTVRDVRPVSRYWNL